MSSASEKRQIEALKALAKRWSADPVQLRFVVAVGLFGIGLFAIERPLAGRLARARTAEVQARTQSRLAEELRHFSDEAKSYTPRVAVPADLVDWQNYVLAKLKGSSTTLISLEPKVSLQKQPFTVLNMELVARGPNFREFADFCSRLEHGERFVRLEKVRIERQQTSMYLTMVIRGLVRGAPAEKAKDGAKADKPGKDGGSPKAGSAAPTVEHGEPAGSPAAQADVTPTEPAASDATAEPAAAEAGDD